ncbi:MAG: hypothetical protein DPW09_22705 [Anaerolineae bacterium]|nr:polysaccharide pyruvyl transferase family protein [Anaerolineales bacterium]MCQ3976249.1 hypothetical protein [Anaerolineae bacterium]
MRILLDQAVHDHRNKGNNALLEVALNRLRNFWPEASFEIISISPHFCRVYIPGTHPVFPHNFEISNSLETLHRFMPRPLWRLLFELRERLHSQTKFDLTSKGLRSLLSWFRRGRQQAGLEVSFETGTDIVTESVETSQSPAELYSKIADYDLYIPTGGGYMCDSDKRFLFQMFDRVEAAVAHRVPVVMVGQGIGPMEDPDLLKRAREVLPLIDYIMIREQHIARPLLDLLNVAQYKVIMTGDDALELGYQARGNKLGTGIGLSLRVAAYTQVNEKHIAAIRPVVLQAAKKYSAELIAAPIDVNEADMNHIEEIMKGHHKILSAWQKFETTSDVIKRISRCRVMIGGTFHGAVFALSQGIPVVALAKSVEYHNKLSGLTAEFGEEGCQVIDLNDKNLQEKLTDAIDFAWSVAEKLRPHLLEQTKRQIDLGYTAYQKIYDLVEIKRQTKDQDYHQSQLGQIVVSS